MMMAKMKTGKRPAPQNDQKIRLVLILSFSLLCFMFFPFTYTQTIRLANLKGIVQYENQTTIASNQSEAIGRPPEMSTVLLPPEPEGPRIAICLVGGARRFELTGISLLERVVNVFNNSDLFLHSPLDRNSFKLMLLKDSRSIAGVRIFEQKPLPETKEQRVVLRDGGSPNGVQGLLQYFNLVEGCLHMITEHQTKNRIRYDWIVRTRLDGYWAGPLTKDVFIPGVYVAPPGNGYGGTNDRFGSGDPNTSRIALSRLSLIQNISAAGYHELNSESAYRAQFAINKIEVREPDIPFCVVTERRFAYPPDHHGVPVASMGSRTPLSGSYCRPCNPACNSTCFAGLLKGMLKYWNWIYGEPELCDGSGLWETDWEQSFDRAVGEKYANIRKQFGSITLEQCISDLESMMSRTSNWDAPSPASICRLGLGEKQIQ